MSETKTIRLTALDTLFFKEARPFDSIGGSELSSVFPPPPRTVIGAIRSAIGEAMGVDWSNFAKAPITSTEKKVKEVIGYGDDMGVLSVSGVWLSKDNKRLYPAPLFLLSTMKDGKPELFNSLQIGKEKKTTLGTVRLPERPETNGIAYASTENIWLTTEGLAKVQNDVYDKIDKTDFYETKELFNTEPRLGIARDNSKRVTTKGMLYQTSHIRPAKGVSIEVDIAGIDNKLPKGTIRIGGEGRMAGIEINDNVKPLPMAPEFATNKLILILLTPAKFKEGDWLPDGFEQKEEDGITVYKGVINEIPVTIHSAVTGKALREGGWDAATGKPRPVQSLIPAGSAFYCTVEGDINKAIEALHGKHIGEDSKLGRGRVVCALWKDENNNLSERK